jgi:hypothetical protein
MAQETAGLACTTERLERRDPVPEIAPTPNIAATIGGQIRVYHAFVTTAAPALDGPSTVTLHASTPDDVSGFAGDLIVQHTGYTKSPTDRLDRNASPRLAPRPAPGRAVSLCAFGAGEPQAASVWASKSGCGRRSVVQ